MFPREGAFLNYLAHVFLADAVGASLTGNLMGDFVRGRLNGRFPPAIERGLYLHRRVDTFTDAHPLTRVSRQRFCPVFRRYGGILVDLFYDHCLARQWGDFHDEPLEYFTARVYAALQKDEAFMVESLRGTHRRMREIDLLASYRNLSGLQRALYHLHRRLSRDNPLADGLYPLRAHYGGLSADFQAFMPQLIRFAQREWLKLDHGARPPA
jgi:acyl carrier protein phosphodiesterase